jgi:hypothetical protein
MSNVTRLSCRCGKVHIGVAHAPIMAAECHCKSCRAAAGRLEKLPGAAPVTEDNQGTRFVLYRKDRVRFLEGAALLQEFRLAPDAGTRRVIAGCCGTPIFLEFKGGHWLSLYARLWPAGTAPRIEIRTVTGDREGLPALDGDVPAGPWQTTKFYARLLGAWIAMGFKAPDIAVTGGKVDA